jgi:2-polyprenyl-3-methyl-5-hydroxy-6-metoxy-1,4-benzoquinol methylase/glycosyltransferase involved in cell wall biosynthesis
MEEREVKKEVKVTVRGEAPIEVVIRKPFLSWCLIVRNASKTLEATLKSLRERTPDAEIVVVDTMSSDLGETLKIAEKYADVVTEYAGPRNDWTPEMVAFDDAAAARNFSFSLANGSWIGWIDSDDVLPGPEEAEKLLKENGRWRPATGAKLDGIDDATPLDLEEVLKKISETRPTVTCLYAPYLYRRNADGTAAEWQERERFVRNDSSWHWVGKGHEVLVPKRPDQGGSLGVLSSLLFLHMKEWKPEDYFFSIARHFNALVKEYDAGDRSSRTCLYLENFSRVVCPQRRPEFLQAAYEGSFTPLERCRTLMRAGEFAAEQGFFMDALEAFSGAVALRPDLPDPWLAGAGIFERAEDWPRAAEWYEKGCGLPVNTIESLVNPRDLLIGFRAKAAECFRRAGQVKIRARDTQGAQDAAVRRLKLLGEAYSSEAAGPDKEMLGFLAAHAENDLGALKALDELRSVWNYLVRNEETAKAADLIRLAPHTLEDFPELTDLKAWAEKINVHLEDPEAYSEFYNSSECGAEFNHDLFKPDRLPLPRVQFLIDWLKKEKPAARILEVGCFDGTCGIHVLRACPDVHYVAVDTMEKALDAFRERAIKEETADRLETHLGLADDLFETGKNLRFDVIILFELVEHLPDPQATLESMRNRLRFDGRLFVSTPWGAYDRGRPFNLPTRDPRGHVRAMTARELYETVEEAGFQVETMNGANGVSGATLHLVASRREGEEQPLAVNFFVASALWDWNASKVIETGMGASEETIVYLARRLAAEDDGARVAVYGPIPEDLPCVSEEVRDSVAYWTRAKIADAESGTLIVSRSPSSAKLIDPEGLQDRILWLQDTIYPDLNAATAQDYRAIVVLSEWHKKIIAEQVKGEEDRLVVIPNFILAEHFRTDGAPERENHHFIYASSPDRGLIRLLKLWPKIRAAIPDATLDIFYGWEGCMKLGTGNTPGWTKHYRKVRTEFSALQYQEGVTSRGRVNHETLAREFQRASAWLYPTSFAEAGCLTAVKARAAGCIPVTTSYAALTETAACDQTFFVDMPGVGILEDPTGTPEALEKYGNRFVASVIAATEIADAPRRLMSQEAIDTYELSVILPLWLDLIG